MSVRGTRTKKGCLRNGAMSGEAAVKDSPPPHFFTNTGPVTLIEAAE